MRHSEKTPAWVRKVPNYSIPLIPAPESFPSQCAWAAEQTNGARDSVRDATVHSHGEALHLIPTSMHANQPALTLRRYRRTRTMRKRDYDHFAHPLWYTAMVAIDWHTSSSRSKSGDESRPSSSRILLPSCCARLFTRRARPALIAPASSEPTQTARPDQARPDGTAPIPPQRVSPKRNGEASADPCEHPTKVGEEVLWRLRNRRWHNLLNVSSGCSYPSRRDVDTCRAGRGTRGKQARRQQSYHLWAARPDSPVSVLREDGQVFGLSGLPAGTGPV